MKFYFKYLNEILFDWTYRAALHLAIAKGKKEIVELLLNHHKIDVNLKSILIFVFLYNFNSNFLTQFEIKLINKIQNYFLYTIPN